MTVDKTIYINCDKETGEDEKTKPVITAVSIQNGDVISKATVVTVSVENGDKDDTTLFITLDNDILLTNNKGNGVDSWQQHNIFLFPTASKQILTPTQPPVQWICWGGGGGCLSLGVKWLRCEASHRFIG
jgi:hypothetical protein